MPRFAEIIKPSTDPAAGVEVSWTADEDCIVFSAAITLVTSATVANRRVHLVADDGTNIFFRSPASADATASGTFRYFAFAGSALSSPLGGFMVLPLPSVGLKLRKGDRLYTVTQGIDAGDNYSAMTLQVERQ